VISGLLWLFAAMNSFRHVIKVLFTWYIAIAVGWLNPCLVSPCQCTASHMAGKHLRKHQTHSTCNCCRKSNCYCDYLLNCSCESFPDDAQLLADDQESQRELFDLVVQFLKAELRSENTDLRLALLNAVKKFNLILSFPTLRSQHVCIQI
jgi:hypothetical protein